jgi:hypothetical protein
MQLTEQAIWYHIVTVFSLVVFKLDVLIVGYFIAKLGYDLLIKGVTGQFKFQAEFKGSKADLISASPGIFFILMATILIAIGILKDKPFETKVVAETASTTVESTGEPVSNSGMSKDKPSLPTVPP